MRRTRDLALIWIIGLGLLNFLSYTIVYAYIGGDAKNGRLEAGEFFVRGHFLHSTQGQTSAVSQPVWVYSFIHSISIWPTIGIVLCSMLILSKPHIIATMQEDSLIRGQSFVSAALTIIVIVTTASTAYFIMDFARAMAAIKTGEDFGV